MFIQSSSMFGAFLLQRPTLFIHFGSESHLTREALLGTPRCPAWHKARVRWGLGSERGPWVSDASPFVYIHIYMYAYVYMYIHMFFLKFGPPQKQEMNTKKDVFSVTTAKRWGSLEKRGKQPQAKRGLGFAQAPEGRPTADPFRQNFLGAAEYAELAMLAFVPGCPRDPLGSKGSKSKGRWHDSERLSFSQASCGASMWITCPTGAGR